MKFIKHIGKGAFSNVYLYKDQFNKLYAVKIIQKIHKKKNVTEKVYKEIQILRKLNHKNIIKLYDYKEFVDKIILQMEYCNMGDLSKYIEACKLTNHEILPIFLQLIEALYYLHNKQIVHRDIKSANIFLHKSILDNKDKIIVKLGDFGISKEVEQAITLCGTYFYASPESFQPKKKITLKSDIWSLGIIFYELLEKKPIYKVVENVSELYEKIRKKDLTFFIHSHQSPFFDLLIRMLQEDVDLRPSIAEIKNYFYSAHQKVETNYNKFLHSIDIVCTLAKRYQLMNKYKEAYCLYVFIIDIMIKKYSLCKNKIKDILDKVQEIEKYVFKKYKKTDRVLNATNLLKKEIKVLKEHFLEENAKKLLFLLKCYKND